MALHGLSYWGNGVASHRRPSATLEPRVQDAILVVFLCPPRRGCLPPDLPGKVRQRRVLGPVGTGPRLERRSLYKDLRSFPLHRRFGSKRATPERGQMLRRAVCETASNVFQPRPASPDRGHGVRRDDWGRRSEFASSLDSPSRAPLGL